MPCWRVLQHLRKAGPVSRRDFQRRFRVLKVKDRAALLGQLADEGLVHLESRLITAVPLAEFVQALHARRELPVLNRPEARVVKKA